MISRCAECLMFFEDSLRSTICPHQAFPANDGKNNFTIYHDAYLSELPEGESDVAARQETEE